MYVEALVGPDSVDTIPAATLEAYKHDGQPADRLTGSADDAAQVLARGAELGIDMEAVAAELEADGVAKFVDPFHKLINSIDAKRLAVLS
jgi:transaldolase